MSPTPAILIVEDRGIVAAKIKRDLEGAGFAIAAMAATVALATRLANELPIDGAVLDIDLRGEPVYPVAEGLRRRGVPLLFLTGYSRAALPGPWQTTPLLEKPFEASALARALRATLDGDAAEQEETRVSTAAIRRAWGEVRHMRDLVTEQRAWTEQTGGPRDG